MKPITSISAQAIHDLWSEGFTIVPRGPHDFAEVTPPSGMAYQWNDANGRSTDWKPVPAERHPGVFMPYGTTGDIIVGGLRLDERDKEKVENFHQEVRRKAQKNADDWFKRAGAEGFSGGVTIADGGGVRHTEIGGAGAVHETQIPLDLQPHLARLFKQRDDILAEFKRVTPEINIQDANLRAHAMGSAIMFLRAKIAKENDNDASASPGAAGPNSAGSGSGATDAQAEPPTES